MWKFVIFAAVGYFLYRMFVNDKKRKADTEAKEKETRVASGDLVKDPICGTYIDCESNITVREGETVHRFCSYECRDQFLNSKKALQDADKPTSDKSTAE